MSKPECDLLDIETYLNSNGGKLDEIKRAVCAAAILQEAGRLAGGGGITEELLGRAATHFQYALKQIPF